MERPSCHLSSTQISEVAPGFLDKVCTPAVYNFTILIISQILVCCNRLVGIEM
jgi:hypothetical protein